jgi:hypothetical protein
MEVLVALCVELLDFVTMLARPPSYISLLHREFAVI